MELRYDGSESDGLKVEEEEPYYDEKDYQQESTGSSDSVKLHFLQQTVDGVKELMLTECNYLNSLLEIGFSDCFALLVRFDFHTELLLENYVESVEKTRNFGGLCLTSSEVSPTLITLTNGFFCDICADEKPVNFHLSHCDHVYCCDCYAQYCNSRLSEKAILLTCPESSCPLVMRPDELEQLDRYILDRGTGLGGERPRFLDYVGKQYRKIEERVSLGDKQPYWSMMDWECNHNRQLDRKRQLGKEKAEFTRNYTLCNKMMDNNAKNIIATTNVYKWCPTPDCHGVVKVLPFDSACPVSSVPDFVKLDYVPVVKCSFNHTFCFSCGLGNHSPAVCSLADDWIKKCNDDWHTERWKAIHTKQCPVCKVPIEKDGGCPSMVCTQCYNSFCWDSLKSLNKRNHDETFKAPKRTLSRYLTYYLKFMDLNMSQSQKSQLYSKTEDTTQALQNYCGITWIESQFYSKAINSLIESKNTLKWSYAVAYYLKENNAELMLESNQSFLKTAIEQLDDICKVSGLQNISREKMRFMDAARLANQRRIMLEKHVADAMREKSLKFQRRWKTSSHALF